MNITIKFFEEYNKGVAYDFQGRIVAVVNGVKSRGQAIHAIYEELLNK